MTIAGIARNIYTKAGNVAKKVSGKPLEYTSMAIGAATVVSVLYDSHINGKEKALVNDKLKTADRYEHNFKQYMTLDRKSQTIADLKNFWFRKQQSFSWSHLLAKLTGYATGSIQTLLSNLPETALAILALKSKQYPKFGKTAGGLLVLNGIKTFVYDIVGIGK